MNSFNFFDKVFSKLEEQGVDPKIILSTYESVWSFCKHSKHSLVELKQEIVNCTTCKYASNTPSSDKKLPLWSENPEILFVLDYPLNSQENSDFFISILKDCGFSSQNCSLFYTIPANVSAGDAQYCEYVKCTTHLMKIIDTLSPKVIFLLGKVSYNAIFGESDNNFSQQRGKKIWLGRYLFIPTFSPIYVKLSTSDIVKKNFIADLLQVKELI